jgi:hypothetical protein
MFLTGLMYMKPYLLLNIVHWILVTLINPHIYTSRPQVDALSMGVF